MPELICDLHLTVERLEEGVKAEGPVKFNGNGEDMVLTLAALLSMLHWPKDMMGLVMCADAFKRYKEQCPDMGGGE